MTALDIVMVLPGASSLGAYQAGACAGVLAGRNALIRLGADVRIPSIGGASAGATVALQRVSRAMQAGQANSRQIFSGCGMPST